MIHLHFTDRRLINNAKIMVRKDLTIELTHRIEHNQYKINEAKDLIHQFVKTKYKPEFQQVPELLSKLIAFSARREVHKKDIDKENDLVADKRLMKTNVLSELSEIVPDYMNFIPNAKPMSEKVNEKHRLLIDPSLTVKNCFHDADLLKKN